MLWFCEHLSYLTSASLPTASSFFSTQALFIICTSPESMGRDSSVGMATRYELNGPGIETRWGARFSAPVHIGPGTHQATYTMRTGSFPGLKRPGRGVDHSPPSSADAKERAELYLYSPYGPSGPVLGWTLSLLYFASAYKSEEFSQILCLALWLERTFGWG